MEATRASYRLLRTCALLLISTAALLVALASVGARPASAAATRLRVRVTSSKLRTANSTRHDSQLQLLTKGVENSNTSTQSTALDQSCGSFAKRIADKASVLSINCPSVCTDSNFCIYYPPGARDNCSAQYGSSCFDGDSCTFECLKTAGDVGAWYLTLYDSDESFETLDAKNAAYKVASVLVNVSVVTKLDAFVRPSVFDQLCVWYCAFYLGSLGVS